jgi:thermostable 8-oxoguanine DNA glycosylase
LEKEERYRKLVTWDVLKALRPEKRLTRLDETLRAANVRWAAKKAPWLAENFLRIERRGGPAAVKCELQNCEGRDAKIAFLKTFKGIGDKNARNMMMDVYHPDFHDSIAVDSRIKKVSEKLGVTFQDYAEAERFYHQVAQAAGLSGWELDKLLYNFTDEVLEKLQA